MILSPKLMYGSESKKNYCLKNIYKVLKIIYHMNIPASLLLKVVPKCHM